MGQRVSERMLLCWLELLLCFYQKTQMIRSPRGRSCLNISCCVSLPLAANEMIDNTCNWKLTAISCKRGAASKPSSLQTFQKSTPSKQAKHSYHRENNACAQCAQPLPYTNYGYAKCLIAIYTVLPYLWLWGYKTNKQKQQRRNTPQ